MTVVVMRDRQDGSAVDLELVIFDCDGVLIDSEPLSVRADVEALAECGLAVSEDEVLERYTGVSWADMVNDLTARYGPLPADLAERHRVKLRALFEAELSVIPGVGAVLDGLRCGACVASSGRPERLRHALSLVGLYDRFHPNIFSVADVALGKPAPDLFLYAAATMGVTPQRCIVVEDSLPGIAAAVAAGMTAIGFTGGGHCRPGHDSRLMAQGAAVVIERMEQLPAVLARKWR